MNPLSYETGLGPVSRICAKPETGSVLKQGLCQFLKQGLFCLFQILAVLPVSNETGEISIWIRTGTETDWRRHWAGVDYEQVLDMSRRRL